MRIMAGAPARAHTLELFRRFNIVQLDEYRLYKYSIYIFLYKLVNQLHPLSVQSAFALNNSVHHYSTRHSEFLHVNTYECATRKRALRHQSSIIQNSNPGIDYRVSFPSFKFHIRTLLLYDTDWSTVLTTCVVIALVFLSILQCLPHAAATIFFSMCFVIINSLDE